MKKFLISILFILMGCSHYQSELYDQYSKIAEKKFKKSQFEDALEIIKQIETEDVLSSNLLLIKCTSMWELKNKIESYKCLDSGFKTYPHKSQFELSKFNYLIEDDKVDEAQELGLKLQSRMSHDINFLRLKSNLEFKLGDYDSSAFSLEKSLQIEKNDTDLLNLGKSYFLSGKMDKAKESFEKISNNDLKIEAAKYLAWIYIDSKNQKMANFQIRTLLEHYPEDPLTKKLFIRNLTLSQDADRVTLLKEYNKKFEDEWGQYHYWMALKEINQNQEANDYLAHLWNKNKSEAWVASQYANELAQENNFLAAQDVLEQTKRIAKKNNQEQLNLQIAELTKKQEILRSLASTKFYRVEKGETLESISNRFYGTKSRWSDILKHNLNSISDPKKLKIGSDLIIPGITP